MILKKRDFISLTLFYFTLLSLPSYALDLSETKAKPGDEIAAYVQSLGFPSPTHSKPSGSEAEGPFETLVIKNVYIIDGTGAPTQGPSTVVINNDTITKILGPGTGSLAVKELKADENTHVIDAKGKYLLPGLIDAHVHFGVPTHAFVPKGAMTDPDYVGKLWLAHGVTLVRDAGSLMGLGWTQEHREMAAQGRISVPNIKAYALFPESMSDTKQAADWVKSVADRGADGIKFLGARPDIIEAAVNEAKKHGLKTMYHHSQITVARQNVLDSARMGIDSMEHWYGLPEAMFSDRTVQHYSYGYEYNNEQDRFAEAGHLWQQTAKPGSVIWQDTINDLVDLDFSMVPTMTVYEANRDLMRAQTAAWHDEYTMPYMMRSFVANPKLHGSYHFDWTSQNEIDWKHNFILWMDFLRDYKNAGGRVVTGTDSGFIYGVFGFAFIREMELLQEAGFHPLEVIQSATLNGAELLGVDKERGSIEVGKKADLVLVGENPLTNFKVMYGTGHMITDAQTGERARAQGIVYTIKDGIIYDAQLMLKQVREMVAERKQAEATIN